MYFHSLVLRISSGRSTPTRSATLLMQLHTSMLFGLEMRAKKNSLSSSIPIFSRLDKMQSMAFTTSGVSNTGTVLFCFTAISTNFILAESCCSVLLSVASLSSKPVFWLCPEWRYADRSVLAASRPRLLLNKMILLKATVTGTVRCFVKNHV